MATSATRRGMPRGKGGGSGSGGNSTGKVLPPNALTREEVNDLIIAVASLSCVADTLGSVSKLMDDALDKVHNLCETINDRMSIVSPVSGGTPQVPQRGPRKVTDVEEEYWTQVLATDPPPTRQLSFHESEQG